MANITWISLLFISVLIVNVTSDECAVKGEPFKFSRTFSSFEPGVLWKRGPDIIAFVSVNVTAGSGCVNAPQSGYTFECPGNGTTYVLGIDQSSDIDGQTITTNPPSQEGDFTMKVIETRNGTLIIPMVDGLNTTLTKFTFYVNCTKPNATITWAFLPKGDGELTNGIPFNSSVPTTHESSDTGCDIDQFSWTSTISISSDTEQLKLTNHTTFILIARLSFLGCDAVSNVYLYPTDVIIITRATTVSDTTDNSTAEPDSTITPPTPDDCTPCCYSLPWLIVQVVIIVVIIVYLVIHFHKDKEGTKLLLTIMLAVVASACISATINQILYFAGVYECGCCTDEVGWGFAIFFQIITICGCIFSYVIFVIRIRKKNHHGCCGNKPRDDVPTTHDSSTAVDSVDMKPHSNNVKPDPQSKPGHRPLPQPKQSNKLPPI